MVYLSGQFPFWAVLLCDAFPKRGDRVNKNQTSKVDATPSTWFLIKMNTKFLGHPSPRRSPSSPEFQRFLISSLHNDSVST